MSVDVLCLRPEADFIRVGVATPAGIRVAYRAPADPDVPALMKQARVLLIPAVGPKLPMSIFDGSSVRLVQVTGAGLDRIDPPALRAMGIAIANVPGGSNSAIAEYVVAAASLLLRRLLWADAEVRAGRYTAVRAQLVAGNLAGLDGLVVGVVGLGVVGLAVAQAFHRAGCAIGYYDPAPGDPSAAEAIPARAMTLDELLGSADVVTLHVPLLPETRGLIGARELDLMKRGGVLIQAARGGVVDEAALAEHLSSGHLGGAAVDVYSSEPPPPDHPLLALQGEAAGRLLLTPHIAGVTRQSAAFLLRAAWENVERALKEAASAR